MSYAVKEIFYTLQGEGANAGRAAVFCRFAGCNLWSGRSDDRATARCNFCDTDFVGVDGSLGGRFESAKSLADAVRSQWPANVAGASMPGQPLVVLTGGEPALQLDSTLIDALHRAEFEIAIETNGSLPIPEGIDWVCVSPKANVPLAVRSGNELKLVFPQVLARPEQFEDLHFDHFLLQPMDALDDHQRTFENTQRAVKYCLDHPRWRLSIQTHKALGIR